MISNERLREMASPTWRFVGDEYREAIKELLERREADMKACTVGTTTKYPDMPSVAWDKLREERDALLVENTQHLEQLEKQREQIRRLKEALVLCEYRIGLHLQGQYPDDRALYSAITYARAALYEAQKP